MATDVEIERLPMVRLTRIKGGEDSRVIGIHQAAQKLWAIGHFRSRRLALEALFSGSVIETLCYRWQVVTE